MTSRPAVEIGARRFGSPILDAARSLADKPRFALDGRERDIEGPDMDGIALIGCGRWGRNLARVLNELGALSVIVDPFLGEDQLPDGVAVPIQRDIDEALNDPSIAGVVIAAPAVQHAELATRALQAGKHVFVEKPLAMTVEDAEAVATLAQDRGLTLMVGHLLQYHPAFRKLADLVAAGEIGAVRHIASNRLNPGAIRTEENALWSLAPHDFSMILGLAGAYPSSVNALAVRVVDAATPDRYVVTMGFDGGMTAQADVSWISPYKEHRLTVLGETGALILDDHAADRSRRLVLYRNYVDRAPSGPRFVKDTGEAVAFDAGEPLKAEMEAFVAAMTGAAASRTGPDEAIPVLRLLRQADESAEAKG